jgi:hypothetical protein
MNGFTLLTILGGFGVIFSFFSGIGAMVTNGTVGRRRSPEWMAWRVVFQGAVFLTILAAPLSR